MTGNKAFIESIHPIIVFEIFEIMAPNAWESWVKMFFVFFQLIIRIFDLEQVLQWE